jgi:hypothetical protein
MPRIASVTSKQLTVADPYQTKERVIARLGSLPVASFSVTAADNNIDEDSTLTINITTANISNGRQLRWRILDRPNDFTINTGLVTISSDAGSFSVTPVADLLTEGAETFRVQIEKLSGSILAVSSSITINDTSSSTWTIVPNSVTANEGDTLTYTCTLTGGTTPNGTVLTWTANTPDLTVNTGTVTIVDGSASFTVTISNDFITEGVESFTVNLRSGDVDGPIVGTSTAVTIADTSVETYSISAASAAVDEGSPLSFTVSTQGVSNGTTLYWTLNRPEDFSISSGQLTINNNTGSFSVTPAADSITEGVETFTASVRTGSTSGDIVATSSSITINDTSLTPTELNLTGLSSSSYTADSSGLLFITLDSTIQAQEAINVLFQGVSTVGTASDRVRLTLTRQSDGGLLTVDYLGFFDSSDVSVVSGSVIRVGRWESFERSDITSYHSLATMAGGSVTNQVITGLSIETGLAASVIDYLMIAGGGGGGSDGNGGPGGGGAGGYRTGTGIPLSLATNYTISVGGGGANSARGGDSYISSAGLTENPSGAGSNTIKAYGGGFGGRDGSGAQQGASGGSGGGGGGGGWGGSYAGGDGNTPATVPSQGNNGGSSTFFGASDGGGGGGGGGAGGVGSNASGNNGGNGGIGAESPITTSVVRRAGGGGGRNRSGSGSNGTGGAGGGGNAGSTGSPNTGGGGGGLSTGGSGVVILRYPSAFTISNPGGGLSFTTATSVSGVKITTFTAGTGTIQFT